MIAWCVAHTQPLEEILAQQHLLDQSFEVYMPRLKKTIPHARKVEEKLVPLGMDLSFTRWRSFNNTPGVSYFLMTNNLHPKKVQKRIVDDLKAQEVGVGIVPMASLVNFVKDEKLCIVEDAFKDQVAIFESVDDKSRVQLLLNFMGREMKMTLPTYAVEAA
ncbi:transcription termination/antitermination protein NusG [Holospora curviuscula]|uniref:Transcriptional activator RfaH n=1 Tax=Holospora curviuscula TaxID=1082868 RepID=A0A2S5R717_9PROT|nr:transcription termination/antitermination NusG family protein [Holospora curviuscula]PPE03131.1 transcriptional activator RfaH [Holospora curviuscula]